MCWTKLAVKKQGAACMPEALRYGVTTALQAHGHGQELVAFPPQHRNVVDRDGLHVWITMCKCTFVQDKGKHKLQFRGLAA